MTPTRFLRAALYRRNLATAIHSGLGGGAPSAVACDISALGLFVLSRSLLSFVDLYSTTLESITPPYDWCAQNIVDLLTQLHPQKINNSARVNIDMDSTTERVPRVRNLPARFVDKNEPRTTMSTQNWTENKRKTANTQASKRRGASSKGKKKESSGSKAPARVAKSMQFTR